MQGIVERVAVIAVHESAFMGGSLLVFLSIDDHLVRLWFSSVFRGIRAKVIQTIPEGFDHLWEQRKLEAQN
jgi:hypothetical protein